MLNLKKHFNPFTQDDGTFEVVGFVQAVYSLYLHLITWVTICQCNMYCVAV